MATTRSEREVGRPRLFSDEAIFGATHLVLRRDGFREFTLEKVALEVGCTRQALVRRFGSKRQLLLSAVEATADKLTFDYGQVRQSWDSPIAALRARLVLPPNSRPEASSAARPQANLLAFILTTSADPEFGQQFAGLQLVTLREIEDLLRAAVEQRELATVDTAALAQALLAAWTGETISVCCDPSLDQTAARSAIFEQIVGPYRIDAQG